MKNSNSGVLIPAGIFIGMGVGFIIDELVGGLFIGLGAGFLLMVIVELFTNNNSKTEK